MDGYSKVDEYGNSRIWTEIRSVQNKVRFIRCEAKVSSRVNGVK